MKRIAALGIALFAALPASASIALFTDGRSMKISGYKLVDESAIQLTFKNGGAMTIGLARIERIVDDEFIEVEKAPEVTRMIEEGVFPKRSWHYEANRGPIFRSKYDKMIVEAAKKFDVDAALVSAVIKAESDFNPREISNKGARGLMQLMPATAERFGVVNSFDANANINGGVRYNAGEGNIARYNGVPPFRETIHYINRIAKHVRVATQTAVAVVSSGAVVSSDRK